MTVTQTKSKNRAIEYSNATVKRAEIALFCSPFQMPLLAAMRNTSIPLPAIASENGYRLLYTKKTLTEALVERELIWLIKVGLLRREVDGQGITDSFRLTPLGRQILEKWQSVGESFPQPSWLERVYNALNFLVNQI